MDYSAAAFMYGNLIVLSRVRNMKVRGRAFIMYARLCMVVYGGNCPVVSVHRYVIYGQSLMGTVF